MQDVSRLRDRLERQQEARHRAEEARQRAQQALEAATQRATKAEEGAARLNLSVEAARDAARSAREAAKAATSSKSLGEADLARERSEARAARRAKGAPLPIPRPTLSAVAFLPALTLLPLPPAPLAAELAVREAEDVERRAIAAEARAERCMERERAAVDSGRDSRDSRDRARRDASEVRDSHLRGPHRHGRRAFPLTHRPALYTASRRVGPRQEERADQQSPVAGCDEQCDVPG